MGSLLIRSMSACIMSVTSACVGIKGGISKAAAGQGNTALSCAGQTHVVIVLLAHFTHFIIQYLVSQSTEHQELYLEVISRLPSDLLSCFCGVTLKEVLGNEHFSQTNTGVYGRQKYAAKK